MQRFLFLSLNLFASGLLLYYNFVTGAVAIAAAVTINVRVYLLYYNINIILSYCNTCGKKSFLTCINRIIIIRIVTRGLSHR
jgi:hypothetical protein